MTTIDTVVVGAGHAGLAVSRLLSDADREHVVLERGRIAERWRSERWDSLHLLTPAWMTRLPGHSYRGPEQERYLSAGEFVAYLADYAESFQAPVAEGVTVKEVQREGGSGSRFRVVTDAGTFHTWNVVVATGPHGVPTFPQGLESVDVLPSSHYRNPGQLPDGGVLVVGASSSGVQLADELNRAGREVVLAVGRHTRMPRRYRGMDIFWWLESTGRLARTIDDVTDPAAARGEPSLQLVGRNEPDEAGRDLDLAALQGRGVRLAGRLDSVARGVARFRADLADAVSDADARMHRFLDAADGFASEAGLDSELLAAARPRAVSVPRPLTRLDLPASGVTSVLVATGFRPDHSWLRIPEATDAGSLQQYRGVTPVPGLYVVGQRFQHRRDSGFIDGARHDAVRVVSHLLARGAASPGGQHGLAVDRPAVRRAS